MNLEHVFQYCGQALLQRLNKIHILLIVKSKDDFEVNFLHFAAQNGEHKYLATIDFKRHLLTIST